MTTTPTPTLGQTTIPEKLLLAAADLSRAGVPFLLADLTVAVWRRFPATFGLQGHEQKFPDSNKVICYIVGVKGLASRGLLQKTGPNLYTLTPAGRAVIARAQGQGPEAPPSLSREHGRFLRRLLESEAVRKFEAGEKMALAFVDACAFWGVNEWRTPAQIDAALELVRRMLAETEQACAAPAAIPGGRVVTAGDVRALGHVHRWLEDRFERHLNLLRKKPAKNGR